MQRISWSHFIALLHYYANTFCDKTNDPKSQNTRTPETPAFWLAKKILHNNLCVYVLIHTLSYQLSYICFTSYHYIDHWFIHLLYNILYDECSEDKTEEYSSAKYQWRNWGGTFPANNCWSSRRLEDVLKTCLQNVFSTSLG